MTGNVLTINGGSSSIKFAVFAPDTPPQRLLAGIVERIGLEKPVLRVTRPAAETRTIAAANYEQAVAELIAFLDKQPNLGKLTAIGHRIVHGGPRFFKTEQVDAVMVAELKRLIPLDPAHLPGEIALLEAFTRRFPHLPQVAAFDTAFHHDLPRVARLLPVPRRLEATGVRRYGFHGLSFTYLMQELARVAGPDAVHGRVILAHLGAGASLAAVRDGKCLDTTMAFTPTAGLVMATRCGDIDPGLLIHLLRSEGMNADQLDDLVNRQSGLLGISETSPDVRDLLARESTDPRAAEALAIFCQQARKWIGAFAAVLGGLDTLVFSAGIGENSAQIRARICADLEFLGIALDPAQNAVNAAVISATSSPCTVRVIPTDEESLIAHDVFALLNAPGR